VHRHPNILILYADQMQHDRMGFVDGIAHTPNLDALASAGVHFSHAVTQQGQCVPSRAVLLSGQSAHECGVMVNYGFFEHSNRLTARNRTFAQVLRETGYTTAWFGKGHLGSPLADLGFDHGDTFDAHTESATGGRPLDPDDAKRLGCDYVPTGIAVDYKATEDAVQFVHEHQTDDSPLCLVLSLHFPHPPWFSERRFIDLFSPEKMPLPESFQSEDMTGKPDFVRARAAAMKAGGFDETTLRRDMADYYSMIAAMDDHFGQVMAAFQERGLWDDTLVFFTADHGDMMGAHGLRLKGTYPYDELYRVPLLIKPPATTPPSRRQVIDDLVSSQAYAGTILRLAGVEVPDSVTGGDFADAFVNDRHPQDEMVFFEHYAAHWGLHPFYGVRTRTMKYVRYYGEDDTEELYDLAGDPHERHNRAGDPEYEATLGKLAAAADRWWHDTGGRGVDYYESPDFKANRHNAMKF
jgi:arylsulfatase A-like enzyme